MASRLALGNPESSDVLTPLNPSVRREPDPSFDWVPDQARRNGSPMGRTTGTTV
jgi:hypothetical protein